MNNSAGVRGDGGVGRGNAGSNLLIWKRRRAETTLERTEIRGAE